ncbi:MAG: hypothetical protein H6Q11_1597, partial [Acidobacteria bacterium]|nr:hypothetical protein [Acidobacteriota bacterium]
LELHVQVAATVGGGVSLTAEFPALKGASGATFSYTLTLSNDTPEEIQFGLTAEGPEGWLVDAQPAAQARASTVTLGGGEMSLVTVTVDPPDNVSAGIYPLRVRAAGSGETVTTELTAEITGRYGMDLTTTDERLNFDIEAGGTREVQLVLENTGTGGLTAITFTAQPPAGWTVRFSPDFLDLVGPGESAPVTALVIAADDAVAGDYVLSLETESNEASDTVEFRAAVETSTAWGLVGLIVIIVALGGLAVVFWRFGRR